MVNATVTVTVEVPDSDIGDLIETAGYGIGYWASSATVDEDNRTYTITENDEGDFEEHVVTYDQLAEAISKVASGDGAMAGFCIDYIVTTKNGYEYATEYFDSDVADVVVQTAIFGEPIYG